MTTKTTKRPRRLPKPASAPSPIGAMVARMLAVMDRATRTDDLASALGKCGKWGDVDRPTIGRWSDNLWQEYWALEEALLRAEPMTLSEALVVLLLASKEVDNLRTNLEPLPRDAGKHVPPDDADMHVLWKNATTASFAIRAAARVMVHLFHDELPPRFVELVGEQAFGVDTHGPDIDRLPEEATIQGWREMAPPKPANAA